MNEEVKPGGRQVGKLEDITAANTWQAYRESCLPADLEQFPLERLEAAWLCGAYAAYAMTVRLRRESLERRDALIDRLLGEVEARIGTLDGVKFQAS